MKKLLLPLIFLLIGISGAFAQNGSNLAFMSIPGNGTLEDFIFKMESQGYTVLSSIIKNENAPKENDFSEKQCETCVSKTCKEEGKEEAVEDEDTWVFKINQNICIACGACVDECPVAAIETDGTIYIINPDECLGCGICAFVCPVEAIIKSYRF